ncbi:flagellar basal body rod protein FlgC [Henriciella barbarensis]|uniref:Flagellar basal body rod protein FlgC n=1 Tax=Henriciella barbarensis TaxID=86342 RepID=A0A399QY36_9PROT|nr:flagellar basal body rod C-terminal domain-containing protein [Henriciella barbarensis]RIJ23693.1 flagellar basal body rod protein FlgC [Henriciella barbarensis]
MNSIKATMLQAMQGMRVQSERIDLTSQNISNADTPGYQRKTLIVDKNGDAFRNLRIQLDETEGERSYEPAHPMADPEGYVTLSNVQVVTEMADMREANRSYEANLNSFQQARTMYKTLLEVLKR